MNAFSSFRIRVRAIGSVGSLVVLCACGRSGLLVHPPPSFPDGSPHADVEDASVDAAILDVPLDQPDVSFEDLPDAPVDGGADGADVTLPVTTPRLLAPLSTSTVTSRRPRLSWLPAGATDSAHVEVCRDRACASVLVAFDATGGSGAPAVDLPTGVVFWRARANPADTTTTPTWQFTVGPRTASTDASWGTTLDVNGDGFADVAVAAPREGRVFVYAGGAAGVAATPMIALEGPPGFGGSVASAGDLNGDGFGDLVVGSPTAAEVDVFFGSAGGLGSVPSLALVPPVVPLGVFGASVGSAGDVNGDGYADLLLGMSDGVHGADPDGTYLYQGGALGVPSTPTIQIGIVDDEFLPYVATSAGDLNADGFGDLLIASSSAATGAVFEGRASGITRMADLQLEGRLPLEYAFTPVAPDLNGDGRSEVILIQEGGPWFVDELFGSFLGHGVLQFLPASSTGVAIADFDGDGFSDVAVPTISMTNHDVFLEVARGGPMWSSDGANLVLHLPASTEGTVLTPVGDVNGDGFADLAATMPTAGAVGIFLGGPTLFGTLPDTVLSAPAGVGSFGGTPVAHRMIRSLRHSGLLAALATPH